MCCRVLYAPLAGIAVLLLMLSPGVSAQERVLTSVKTDAAPTIDGTVDPVWSKAPQLSIALEKLNYEAPSYKGMSKTVVKIRSLHDAQNIYFLVQWADPTQSLDKEPWVKQADGSWKQMAAPDDSDHENTYYQDKLGMFWDINASGFEARGCTVACHKARGGHIAGFADKSPGRKYTNKPGETIDMWEWKAVDTNPAGQIDDGFVDDTKGSDKNPSWGRKHDNGAGGTVANASADGKAPAFMGKDPASGASWVLDSEKAPFADTFKAGDRVGSAVVAGLTGSRGDIAAKGHWEGGTWTVEIQRKLVTGGAKSEDVQFSDLKKAYYFGVSAFDNTEIDHVYHEGSNKLVFK